MSLRRAHLTSLLTTEIYKHVLNGREKLIPDGRQAFMIIAYKTKITFKQCKHKKTFKIKYVNQCRNRDFCFQLLFLFFLLVSSAGENIKS